MNVFVIMYLLAVVAANLSAYFFGPSATIVNAFLFIGLDLTARDRLHDAWHGRRLLPKMALLIAAGGALSAVINSGALRIALASTIAFVAAALLDTVVYHFLRRRSKLLRINGSNIPSAAADSLLFPTIAFGSFLPLIVLGQFVAKVFGGFLWSIALHGVDRILDKRAATEGSHAT